MLGETQKRALKNWMLDAQSKGQVFKFIFLSVGFTTSFNDPDSLHYGNYKTERAEILSFIKTNKISGVVFFTGKAHFAYAMELEGEGKPRGSTGLYEFSVSPVNGVDVTSGGLTGTKLKQSGGIEDRLLFSEIGPKGRVQFYAKATINTQSTVLKPQPSILIEYFRQGGQKIAEFTLSASEVRAF
jgi:hypothetical protein